MDKCTGVSARLKRPSPFSVENPLKAGMACASGSISTVLKQVPNWAAHVGGRFPADSQRPTSQALLPQCRSLLGGFDGGGEPAGWSFRSQASHRQPRLVGCSTAREGSPPQLCPKRLHGFLLKSAKLRRLGTLSGRDGLTKGLRRGLEDAARLVISCGLPPPAGPAAE